MPIARKLYYSSCNKTTKKYMTRCHFSMTIKVPNLQNDYFAAYVTNLTLKYSNSARTSQNMSDMLAMGMSLGYESNIHVFHQIPNWHFPQRIRRINLMLS